MTRPRPSSAPRFPDGHTEVKTTDTQELKDDFAISALFGWRWKDFGLRAGLIESRGGAGLDYMLLKDRLRFSADLWDFNRPRLLAAREADRPLLLLAIGLRHRRMGRLPEPHPQRGFALHRRGSALE